MGTFRYYGGRRSHLCALPLLALLRLPSSAGVIFGSTNFKRAKIGHAFPITPSVLVPPKHPWNGPGVAIKIFHILHADKTQHTTHPDATIRYHASDMILKIHSDASYLSEPKARSRAGGHFFLSDRPTDLSQPPITAPTPNGPLHTSSVILRNVMASAAEAEIGALFVNAQDGTVLRTTLIELGHPQPATPVMVDNATAVGIANRTVKQIRSRAMDMLFYFLRYRVRQNHFLVYWKPGRENLGDYFTKHHPPAHHQTMCSTYLQVAQAAIHSHTHIPCSMRGCVDSSLPHTTQAHNPAHNLSRNLSRLTQLLKHRLSSLT